MLPLFDAAAAAATADGPAAGASLQDAKITDDGALCCFVADKEVYACDVAAALAGAPALPRRVTFGARGTDTTHGLADFLAMEEMDRMGTSSPTPRRPPAPPRSHPLPSHTDGYWMSPDGSQLAFQSVDDSPVPVFTIVHQGTNPVTSETHRYPFAGADNPKVALGVVSLAGDGSEVVWLDTTSQYGEDMYVEKALLLLLLLLCARMLLLLLASTIARPAARYYYYY